MCDRFGGRWRRGAVYEGEKSPCRGNLGFRVAVHGQTEEMCVDQNLCAFDLWQLGSAGAPSAQPWQLSLVRVRTEMSL